MSLPDASPSTVVFVTRASDTSPTAELARKRLKESLQFTRQKYEESFGPLTSGPYFYTFCGSSNRPLGRSSITFRFFEARLYQLPKDEKLIVVINGWDGLTTDRNSFVLLFGQHTHRVLLRVFAEEPRQFFAVDVKQVCDVFESKTPFDMEDSSNDHEFTDSIALFLRKFHQIGVIKRELGNIQLELRAETSLRNTPKEPKYKFSLWVDLLAETENQNTMKKMKECPRCHKAYATQTLFTQHMRLWHPSNPEDLECGYCGQLFLTTQSCAMHAQRYCKKRPSAVTYVTDEQELVSGSTGDNLKCGYCGHVFTVSQNRSRHEKKYCKKRPAVLADITDKQEAIDNVTGSGNDNSDRVILPYQAISDDDYAIVKELPPLNIADPFGKIIYQGEQFCRWPMCRKCFQRFSPEKLPDHYIKQHQFFEFPWRRVEGDNQSERGLQWLARVAQLGKENAGPQPMLTH